MGKLTVKDTGILSSDKIKDLCEKLLTFCEKVSGQICYKYQREYLLRVIESIVVGDADDITALFARQSGKTHAIGIVVSGLMIILPELAKVIPMLSKFKDGIWFGIFAPTLGQGSTTYDRARMFLKSKNADMIMADPDIDKKKWEKAGVLLGINNGSFCRVQSGSKQSKVESKTYHVIIIEEAQDVDDDKITRQIGPMGAAVAATQLYVGTPGIKVGEFYKSIQRNKQIKKGKKRNHFEYNYKVCQKYNPNYKKYVAKQKIKYGEDSDAFRMAYNIEWLLERGMFCTLSQIEALYLRTEKLILESDTGVQVAGIDFGKQNDATVITVLDVDEASVNDEGEVDVKICNWLEMEGDNYEEQYPRMIDFLEQYNLKTICADNTGVGQPIVDRLDADLGDYLLVLGIHFNNPKISELYTYLAKLLSAGRLYIPAHPVVRKSLKWRKFVQQMTALEKTYKGTLMLVHHPKLKDAHDDYATSLALALEASKSDIMPEIEELPRSMLF